MAAIALFAHSFHNRCHLYKERSVCDGPCPCVSSQPVPVWDWRLQRGLGSSVCCYVIGAIIVTHTHENTQLSLLYFHPPHPWISSRAKWGGAFKRMSDCVWEWWRANVWTDEAARWQVSLIDAMRRDTAT